MRMRRAQHDSRRPGRAGSRRAESGRCRDSSRLSSKRRTGCPIPNWPIDLFSSQMSLRGAQRRSNLDGTAQPARDCFAALAMTRQAGMERIESAGSRSRPMIAGSGPPLLFLHGGDYVAQNRPFLDRLARRFRVVAPRHPGLRQYAAPGLVPHRRTTSPISISTCSTASTCGTRCWSARRLAAGSRSRSRCARRRRLGRLVLIDSLGAQIRRPRGARHRRHLRAAGRRGAAPQLRRSRPGRARLRQARRRRAAGDRARPRGDRALRLEALYAQPGVGALAAPGDACRRWCCGAKRTASSRRPMARSSPRRCRSAAFRADRRRRRITRRSSSPTRSPTRSSALPRRTEPASFTRIPTKVRSTSRGCRPSPDDDPSRRYAQMTARHKAKRTMMQVWHFSEMAYHPAWPQLGDTYRVTIPSRLFDPQDRRRPLPPLSRRVGAVRRARHQHHDQRAPRDRDLRRLGVHDPDGDPGARDQEGAAPRARHADRQPQRPDPRRRGIFDDRRHLARPASRWGSSRACRSRSRRPTPTRPT